MRRVILIFFILAATGFTKLGAQQSAVGLTRTHTDINTKEQKLDTNRIYNLPPAYVFAKKRDKRKYDQLVKRIKKVYPYAKEARVYMDKLEKEYANLSSSRDRERFTSQLEKEIVKKYTPVLKQMTVSEGRILIKLIDRELNMTSYDILREFRGRFSAGLWNGIAKIFNANLKEGYDKDGDDAMIEHIVTMIEQGAL